MHPQTINWIQLRYIKTGDINIAEKRFKGIKFALNKE